MPDATMLAAAFGALSTAVTVLWRQSVIANREYVASLQASHSATIERMIAMNDDTKRLLQTTFAEQIKIARDDNAQMKAVMYDALGMARKSLDVVKDQTARVGGANGQA